MKYLIFKIPTSKKLTQAYRINDAISLLPSQKLEFPICGIGKAFLRSFLYIEVIKNIGDQDLIYENLKEFIRFWAFMMGEDFAIRALETSPDWPQITEKLPEGNHSDWENHAEVKFDPEKIRIGISLNHSSKEFSLCDLFKFYMSAERKLKDQIALFIHHPNRYVIDSRKTIYNNYQSVDKQTVCRMLRKVQMLGAREGPTEAYFLYAAGRD